MNNDQKPLSEDELALRIGHLTFLWNDVHFFVYTIFVRLMGGDYARSDTIFFGLRNDNSQRQITDKLAKTVLASNEDISKKITSFLSLLGHLAGRRNAFIHAMWVGRHLDKPGEVFEASSPGLANKDVREEIDDLLSTCTRLADEAAELDQLVEKAMNKRLSIERLAKAFLANPPLEVSNEATEGEQNPLNYLSDC